MLDETIFEPCSRCGGEMGVMGMLGMRLWARCRGCGIEESEIAITPEEMELALALLADDQLSGFFDLEEA